MGYAEFHGEAEETTTTPAANFNTALWTSLIEDVADPSVYLAGGGVVFGAGLYVVTANIVAEVTLPVDAADESLIIEAVLHFPATIGT